MRSPQSLIDDSTLAFSEHFVGTPTHIGVAPGRVELLGNHTDYNAGSTLSVAIDRHIVVVGKPRTDNTVLAYSPAFDSSIEFLLGDGELKDASSWGVYVFAVFSALHHAGLEIGGAELVVTGNIPIGSGLSSSAALECAIAMFVLQSFSLKIESTTLAKILQQCEHDYVGVKCGLLDQFSSIHGQAGKTILLDNFTGNHKMIPLGDNPPAIIVCNSKVQRDLRADSPYNLRHQECHTACDLLGKLLNRNLAGLCKASSAELNSLISQVPPELFRRAKHVISESERVLAVTTGHQSDLLSKLGQSMVESHESSRINFENSCDELNLLCKAASMQPGFLGARLCGAGWGGCTVNLVEHHMANDFMFGMNELLGINPPEIFICYSTDGAYGMQISPS